MLYTVFEVQAWLALAVGGLLSFNILFPSDQPDIARLIGCGGCGGEACGAPGKAAGLQS